MESPPGFFFNIKRIDFGIRDAGKPVKLIEYQAAPQTIATIVSSRLATLHELDTIYGVEDLWILLEINSVDRHNAYLMNKG